MFVYVCKCMFVYLCKCMFIYVSSSIMIWCIMLIQLCSSCVCFLGFNLSVKVIVQCVLAGANGISAVVFGVIVFHNYFFLEVVINVKSTKVHYKLGAMSVSFEM